MKKNPETVGINDIVVSMNNGAKFIIDAKDISEFKLDTQSGFVTIDIKLKMAKILFSSKVEQNEN